MRVIAPEDVPEFTDVVDFAEWYINSGTPVLLPTIPEVFLSDDATATCLFRHGRFQFEMYFIHPSPRIPKHGHPGVDNIELPQSQWNGGPLKRDLVDTLRSHVQRAGMLHGPGSESGFRNFNSRGFALYSAQKWDEGIEMSTIGARWIGPTVGPKHEALIRRFNPDCLIENGYADVTKKMAPAIA